MVKINGNRSGEVGRMLGKKMEYLRWFFQLIFYNVSKRIRCLAQECAV